MKGRLRGVFSSFVFECLYWVFLAGVGVTLGFLFLFFSESTDVSTLLDRQLSQTSGIYDRMGRTLLYELHGEENRKIIGPEDIPDIVRKSTIAAEDRNFFRHFGVDVFSIFRAVRANWESGRIEQGASTITQQLARLAYLSNEKTYARKLREAILAVKIEREFSKDEILHLYLNIVPYGSNAYGIEKAAEIFFGKRAKELTLDEAVLLAALPRATTYYSPYGSNQRELLARQTSILSRLAEDKLLSPYEVALAKGENTIRKIKPLSAPIRAPHFVFAVIDELEKYHGREFLETRGLSIRTTINLDLQREAEAAIQAGVARNRSYGAENAALVAVDVSTGDVVAMVGSRGYFDTAIDGKVNVTMRERQPGSAFKPFAYARAFEEGYEPETIVYDVPTNFGPDGTGRDYMPKDYDGRYRGALPMKESLPQSLNIPAVQTLAVSGVSDVIELARRLGISTLDDGRSYGLALVLGGAEVRPLDMASAFSVFASEGVRRPYRFVLSVQNGDGSFQETSSIEESRVLSLDVARRINTILSDDSLRAPIFGSGGPLAFPKGTVAAKTGTTQDFRDAWTVGYTSNLSVAVWAGNNDNSPMRAGADGVYVAAPIWRDFLNRVLDRYPEASFASYTPISTDIYALKSRFGKSLPDEEKKDKKEKKKKK